MSSNRNNGNSTLQININHTICYNSFLQTLFKVVSNQIQRQVVLVAANKTVDLPPTIPYQIYVSETGRLGNPCTLHLLYARRQQSCDSEGGTVNSILRPGEGLPYI